MTIVQVPSPNYGYPTGRHGRNLEQVQAIVCHIAAGTKAGLDATFRHPNGVSAHYGVMKDGTVHQYVDEADAAYHAGILHQPDALSWVPSSRRGVSDGRNVNERSVGIEHEGQTGEALTDAQFAATVALQREIIARYAIPVDREHIVGHYQLDHVTRAHCPGDGFPWVALMAVLQEEEPMDQVTRDAVTAGLTTIWTAKAALEAPLPARLRTARGDQSQEARLVRVKVHHVIA